MISHAKIACLAALIVAGLAAPTAAETLVFEGVLGNSGEQGATLLKRLEGPNSRAIGMGVVCDKNGALWDRTTSGVLSRLAPDGRILGQYSLPQDYEHDLDHLTLVGNDLVILLAGAGLFTLPIDAAPGSAVRPLNVAGIRAISSGAHDGKLAALDKTGRLLLLRVADGSVEPIGSVPDAFTLEMAPDGAIYIPRNWRLFKYVQGREVMDDGWPRKITAAQLVGGNWFNYTYHNTVVRYSADFQPAPGVVLGGASGSFLGFLEGNNEAYLPRGLALLAPDLYAMSATSGILHIVRWLPEKKRFEIVRRIGSMASCGGLALDRAGNVRCGLGCWRWDDLPDAPQRFSSDWLNGPAMTGNDNLISFVQHGHVNSVIRWGPVNSIPTLRTSRFVPRIDVLDKLAGAATYRRGNDYSVLALNPSGKGQIFRIGPNGEFAAVGPRAALQAKTPVKEWTALARRDDALLLAAADGRVFELVPDGDNWKETRAWSSWGAKKEQKFGSRIALAADDKRLWVADQERHRVLCFSSDGKKLLASFGQTDRPGDDLEHLNAPTAIAARGDRAVVYDSANQRLMKLRIK